MKKFSLGILLLTLFFSACISDSENTSSRFEKELDRIEEFLRTNDIPSVKELSNPDQGIYMFWQELSNSGLQTIEGDSAFVDYTGRLLDKSVFDTSIEQVARDNNRFNPNRTYEPLAVWMGFRRVIPGFEFAISQMEEGDKATIIFPSIFGYGDDPRAGELRNEPLIFEIHLIEVRGNRENDDI
ncbi:FKBP-type peptidyl-prolyl cis-trans isomerase [Mongoliitalea daihaiensis]|uniref:FKBP-type peptidyl-prolyl cis-trans isomerase n=1 Tax=Mongoliitalea daihaiensis TaxID=2782006 RepID=UPI001F164D3E|nr:FKBP-type peptidyl-prolyl cis-trans isomerase [Mongoliitalea daihaiensis]UJP66184.1 FKBP-type peptidyl-prolyl cis-trans isomerase [Mongoliitalea daihaiensis]